MKKRLNKAGVIFLVLIMILNQLLVVFAGSEAEPELTNVNSESEIRRTIRERFDKDVKLGEAGELPSQRRINLAEEKAVEEKQLLQAEAASADGEDSVKSGIVPDKIIVKYKTGTSSMMKSALNSKVSAVSSKSINRLGITQLELPRDTNVNSVMDKLKDDPNVEYVEPVYVRNAFGLAEAESSSVVESVYCEEPFYTKGWQWGLEAVNLENMWGDESINERSQVTIAIVDTGVDIDHDELKDSIVPGYDFVNNDSDADDDCGHGTHVAGIAAAAHDGKGIAGVAGGAKIMPVKVLDENGLGSTVEIINGILYAVNNGADVINLSLGSNLGSRAEEEAVQYALGRGVTVVAAAGNDYSGPVSYPAAYDGVIAVGAVDWDGIAKEFVMADFSND
ncbi:MAG: S8 family serine peptidase, partial [Clostridiaceae bacterium]|nr:S8 family serine peptidase [Clostridiaceae bacterium]